MPPYYGNLISKLIIHGKTRNECLMRLRRALEEYVIGGIETTIPLHQRLVNATDFINGDYDIHWRPSGSWRKKRRQTRPCPDSADAGDPARRLRRGRLSRWPSPADDPELFWVDPHHRGILPLDAFHVPRRLSRVLRTGRFEINEPRLRGCHPVAAPKQVTNAPTLGSTRRSSGFTWRCSPQRRPRLTSIALRGMLVGGCYGVSI